MQITNVNRETTGGFDKGDMLVEGSGEYSGVSFLVCFQNENLVAKERKIVQGVLQEKVWIILFLKEMLKFGIQNCSDFSKGLFFLSEES